MILEAGQAQHFYSLWISLLDFVNHEYRIDSQLYGMRSPKGLPVEPILRIREKLWENRSLIDSYVKTNPHQLSNSELKTVSGWKNSVEDTFMILRHLKSGSIFIPSYREDAAYIVCGIYSAWEEMLRGAPLPQAVTTVLIPFEGRIIYDGLMSSYNVRFGGNIKRSLNEHYRKLKAGGQIYKSFGID